MSEETTEQLAAWAVALRSKTIDNLWAICPNTTKPTPVQYIYALARLFPCLENKMPLRTPADFNPEELYESMGGWSHDEQLCVLFVLNVWNPDYAKSKGWDFNLFGFVYAADRNNRAVVQNWLQDPYWP